MRTFSEAKQEEMKRAGSIAIIETRTKSQIWADAVTAFSGSWTFIGWFSGLCLVWILANAMGIVHFDLYPFLFLNWVLTVISTIQNPLILLSQNRQNETDRAKTAEILTRLDAIQKELERLR